ncbi:helix-turn-helix domain-containing protein [Iodobacter ciconiae]|uniref:Helix-turn-helix domain-containing protein n=1 Tax=Iodobacter ciconiae TaxID=2496266 RepID=A0A3S8ZQY7_9NEIS|nr:helix-turn-helix domain-containing protein [Iodobacter ciconiae]AZN35889.1 helix-turn-helix domain-containing protein [Iodobacter ciconiae]
MSENEVLSDVFLLEAKLVCQVQAQALWWLECGEADCSLKLSWDGQSVSAVLPAGWRGALALDRLRLEVVRGTARCQEVRLLVLAKLQAFIDESQNAAPAARDVLRWASASLDVSPFGGRRAAEGWLLRQSLSGQEDALQLVSLLRRTECYWLVRFLLAESSAGGKVHELGERYGVSYSHFRRLCHSALGHAVKTELRDWRMARSLLEVAQSQQSLTAIALKHGYASSSHFSNEIRELLGVSPRGLSNMMNDAIK